MSGVMLVAGESSGDVLGARLAAELKNHRPELRLWGIGGEGMRKAGVECFADSSVLSVMGYWDALLRTPAILVLRRRLLDEIARRRPSLFIGIDAPDFNLNIAARARAMGIKTVQYGSPSVWMWRRNRIKKIRRAVDEVWCLFSFETKSYEQSWCSGAICRPSGGAERTDKPKSGATAFESSGKFPNYRLTSRQSSGRVALSSAFVGENHGFTSRR